MVAVDEAPNGNMNLRFKSAGVVRANRHGSYRIPYSVEIAGDYCWAEDYEI